MPDTTLPDETTSHDSNPPEPLEQHPVIDWRSHVRDRPELWLGVAFVGGMLLAGALKTRSGRELSAAGVSPAADGHGSVREQARQFLNNMKGAFVGVASARIQQYIEDLVPGFDEHYRRAEQRAGGDR